MHSLTNNFYTPCVFQINAGICRQALHIAGLSPLCTSLHTGAVELSIASRF